MKYRQVAAAWSKAVPLPAQNQTCCPAAHIIPGEDQKKLLPVVQEFMGFFLLW